MMHHENVCFIFVLFLHLLGFHVFVDLICIVHGNSGFSLAYEFPKIFKSCFIKTVTKLSGRLEDIFLTSFSSHFILQESRTQFQLRIDSCVKGRRASSPLVEFLPGKPLCSTWLSLVFGACSVWRLFLSARGWCLHISSSLPLSSRLTLFCDLGTLRLLDRTLDGIEYYGLKQKEMKVSFWFYSWL